MTVAGQFIKQATTKKNKKSTSMNFNVYYTNLTAKLIVKIDYLLIKYTYCIVMDEANHIGAELSQMMPYTKNMIIWFVFCESPSKK